jgi:restriction endonuclease S subunit
LITNTRWPLVNFGEVVEISRGISYSSSELTSEGRGRPLLNLRNVDKGGGFRLDGLKYFSGEFKERHRVLPGDLLIANTDLSKAKDVLGSPILVPSGFGYKDAVFSLDLTKLIVNSEVALLKYVAYFLESPEARLFMKANGSGTTVMHLQLKALPNLRMPLPSIKEQYKVVETLEYYLSRLDFALNDVNKVKQNACNFRRSLLHAAFTGNLGKDGTRQIIEPSTHWQFKKLSDCLEKLKSGKFAERGWSPQCLDNSVRTDKTWGVLKTTAVQMGKYQPEYNKELPKSLEPKIGLEVNPGDFLVTTTGPRNRCGIVCNVRTTPKKLIFSGKILRFRANENLILVDWLMFLLMSPEYQKTFDELKVGTSDSSVSIGNQQILNLNIPVPTIEEQQKIIEILEDHISRLDVSISLAVDMESRSIGLRRSLLQSAFSGQLTKEVASV